MLLDDDGSAIPHVGHPHISPLQVDSYRSRPGEGVVYVTIPM